MKRNSEKRKSMLGRKHKLIVSLLHIQTIGLQTRNRFTSLWLRLPSESAKAHEKEKSGGIFTRTHGEGLATKTERERETEENAIWSF